MFLYRRVQTACADDSIVESGRKMVFLKHFVFQVLSDPPMLFQNRSTQGDYLIFTVNDFYNQAGPVDLYTVTGSGRIGIRRIDPRKEDIKRHDPLAEIEIIT